MLGGVLSFFKLEEDKVILSSLAFSSGIMVSISIFELIPSAFNYLFYMYKLKGIFLLCIFILIGILFFYFFDKLFIKDMNNLYRLGFFSMVAIIIHNIPEGILTFLLASNNLKLGIIMALSIALHNIPEGISIMIPIYYGTGSRKKALLYTFIAGISEFFGGLVFYLLFGKYINNLFLSFLFSFISGVMIYLSLFELFPKTFEYKNERLSLLYFMIGIIFFFILHIFLH